MNQSIILDPRYMYVCTRSHLYKARARKGSDSTDYTAGNQRYGRAAGFANHYGPLLSAAVVIGDARRSIACVDAEATRARDQLLARRVATATRA